jgi:hypothetical protein
LICLFLNKTERPQSPYPVLSPTPQLLETIVKSLTPNYLTPLMRFIGTPHIPKPPTKTFDPLVKPFKAYWAFGTNLVIFEKKYKFLAMFPLNICPIEYIIINVIRLLKYKA